MLTLIGHWVRDFFPQCRILHMLVRVKGNEVGVWTCGHEGGGGVRRLNQLLAVASLWIVLQVWIFGSRAVGSSTWASGAICKEVRKTGLQGVC